MKLLYARANYGGCFAIVFLALGPLFHWGQCLGLPRNPRAAAPSEVDDFSPYCNGSLYITISAIKKSCLELNWNFVNCVPDQIRLYNADPNLGSRPIAWVDSYHKKGFYTTKQTLPYDILPNDWERDKNFNASFKPPKGSRCLNYWIAAFKNNELIKKSCLKIQPTWMKDNGDKLGDIPLGKMMIPGTHNSGCYDDYPEADIKIKSIDKFVFTQDRDIWTQLCFGIRYLDVRVGYYNSSNTFWVNHDKFQVNPLKDVLRDLKLFLSKAEDEIAILDLHRFPVGFKNRSSHRQLIDLLHDEVGNITIPRSFQKSPHGPSLKELWKQKRRLIIAYGDKTSAINSDYLWDPLNQQWGNKQSPAGLQRYLGEVRHNHDSNSNTNNPFWASMAELTPTTATVIFGFLASGTSLAQMADSVNRNLTDWYQYDWCDTSTNIVATDFFMGNDLICVAIDCNMKNSMQWN